MDKQERLIEIVGQIAENLEIPVPYKMMVTPLMGQLTASLAQLQESDIDDMIAKFEGFIYYVKHGND